MARRHRPVRAQKHLARRREHSKTLPGIWKEKTGRHRRPSPPEGPKESGGGPIQGRPKKKGWTPYCEKKLMTSYNQSYESFRQYPRGSRERKRRKLLITGDWRRGGAGKAVRLGRSSREQAVFKEKKTEGFLGQRKRRKDQGKRRDTGSGNTKGMSKLRRGMSGVSA